MNTPSTDYLLPEHFTLDQVVAHWAVHRPQDNALCWQEGDARRRLSWSEFDAGVNNMSAAVAADVAVGESVAVVCASGVEFHVLLNALWRVGAAVLLIDRHWGPAIVSDLLQLLGCKVAYTRDGQLASASTALKVRPFPPLNLTPVPIGHAPAWVSPDCDRIALYATTSGTTDNPKCVAISHRRIRSAYRVCLTVHDFSQVRKCACLFEVNSLGILGVNFLLQREIGSATTMFPTFSIASIGASWRRLFQEEFDFVYLVPSVVRLVAALPAQDPALKRVLAFCSAAPVTHSELQLLESRFPIRCFNAYGLTELTFAVFFGTRAEADEASDSIGLPIGIGARLVDDDGNTVSGPGKGELLLTGPMLTDGYVRNERATAAMWCEGWLKTGDIAERDADGRFYIRGRKKDVVFRGGYTYYLHEIEHYLRRAPAVLDACAFRGRDLPSGDELCVVVQVSTFAEPKQLIDWIRTNVGATKVPNSLYVWQDDLPRNSNGKVQRNVLARMHLDGSLARAG